MLHVLTTGTGDGSLTVTVDGYGSFGSAVGLPNNTGAIYDPIGSIGAASTTFQSGVAARLGAAGQRQFLTSGDILGSGGLPAPVITGSSTEASSTFVIGDLSVELLQTVAPLLDPTNTQTGSVLTQRYAVTNSGASAVEYEIVRYIDGDLLFDGSLVDGGGRLVTAGREFLFETDAGGTGSTDTTFLGIDGNGGTMPTVGRFEIDSFAGLGMRIITGTALDGVITGDLDGDGFIDAGQEYDVTLALRNVFVLGAGESADYTTRTVFGSGTPEDLPVDPLVEFGPDVMQLEGDTGLSAFVFTVNLTQANTAVVVEYTTVDGTAVAPTDYEAQSGTLSFEAGGPTTQSITVNVVGDLQVEPDETFFVRLTSVSGGGAPANDAVGTILNDDVELSVNDVSIVEGNTGTNDLVFVVAANGSTNRTVTAGFATVNGTATAPSDYLPRAGNVTFLPGASTALVTVPVVADRRNEGTETFAVLLTGAQNARIADERGTGTIVDDDPLPHFYVSDVQVTTTNPGVSTAVFTVALDVPSGREVVIEFGTADGSAVAGVDYTGQSGTLTFTPGVTTRSVMVPVLIDGVYTGNERFYLNLVNPLRALLADPQGAATYVFAGGPTGEFIIDDGDAGYSRSRGWVNLTNTLTYNLDYDYHAPGDGSAVATWTFADVAPGSYQVFTRWSWFSNRASNAPYSIYDDATLLGTVPVNQQLPPVGDHSEGITWQSLGTYTTATGNLKVRLSNAADGIVVADAVRIVAGGIGPQVPEMDVAGFAQSIDTEDHTPSPADGTDFGSVPAVSDGPTRTFTITNNGNADLHLTGAPRVTLSGPHASDFTILTQPAGSVAPTKKTTFDVIFHPSEAGLRTAVISIANDDDSERPYTFSVHGTGTIEGVSLLVLDDLMSGFAPTGSWTASANAAAYDGQMHTIAPGQSNDNAVWSFSGLAAGMYDVYATWVPLAAGATDARFVVSNTSDHTFTATVNQRHAPTISMDGGNWSSLGGLYVSEGKLRVSLASGADGLVMADAVMIARQGGGPIVEVTLGHNSSLPQDVNDDGRVTPNDLLIVVNRLVMQDTTSSPAPPPTATPASATPTNGESGYFVDVNADGRISTVDALMIVNYLLSPPTPVADDVAQKAASAGAAEPLSAAAVDSALLVFDEAAEDAAGQPSQRLDLRSAERPRSEKEVAFDLLLDSADLPSLWTDERGEESEDAELDPLLIALGQ